MLCVVFITLYVADHVELAFIFLLIQSTVNRKRQNEQYCLLENKLNMGGVQVSHSYNTLLWFMAADESYNSSRLITGLSKSKCVLCPQVCSRL